MTKDEALDLVLDALESCDQVYGSEGSYQYFSQAKVDKAITAIKQARSAPVQEPVATDWERIARVQDAKLRAMCNEPKAFEQLCEIMDRYEALRPTPPAAQPAVPDAFGTREGEHPQYIQGWNDCRAEMLSMRKRVKP
jgi:hypothetical protein